MSSDPQTFSCTTCGAHLPVDGSAQTITCPYCQTQILVPEWLWLRFHPPAPVAPPLAPPMNVAPKGSSLGLILGLAGGVIALVMIGLIVAVTASAKPLNPIASAGDLCEGRQAACAKDGKAELHCGADGKMAVLGTCKGPNGCHPAADNTRVTCDTTYADPKDPCDEADDACSTDHKSELRCQAGHYAVISTCKGPDGCTLTPSGKGAGYVMSCDDHVADVGDPCFASDRMACSSDKKALLTCNAQRFVVDHACKKGCVVRKLAGTDKKEMACE